ncbi:MAG TPA: NIPSNAP family protein [Vicinamibacterales bacterium]|nr:NIPSNAP family protein [Vicinamibacterales bacterium]
MDRRSVLMCAAIFLAGFIAGQAAPRATAIAQAPGMNRVFEIRTYTAPDGKLEELHKRFRDHTLRIFQKHDMTSVAYFRPQDAPLKDNTLIYVLAHPSREAAKKNWADFQADPEWQKVSAESQVNGRIVSKVESVFADPADYSPVK